MKKLSTVFAAVSSAAPSTSARDLTAIFKTLEKRRKTGVLQETYREVLQYFQLPLLHPLAQAGMEIASLIDAARPAADKTVNYAGQGNGYHNQNHMLEDLISTAALMAYHEQGGLEPALSPMDKLVLLTASLSHDIGHNGKGNGMGANHVPLLTEGRSIALAKPVLQKHFGEKRQQEFDALFPVFEALISSTDISGGAAAPGRFFAEAARFQRGARAEFPPAPPEVARFSDMLKNSRTLSEMSCLLQDADLLPSMGLTLEWAKRQELRISEETLPATSGSRSLDWNRVIWFHENLAEFKSRAGKHFAPNFEKIKRHALRMKKRNPPVNP